MEDALPTHPSRNEAKREKRSDEWPRPSHSSTFARSRKAPLQRPGERRSRAAAAVLRDDARFQRGRPPVERLVDRARRAVRGYARHGARQARLVMTALHSMDVDSLATLGASGMAAPNARTVKLPQTRAIGPSIALGKSKLSSEIAQGGASLWRRRSYLSAFLRRPAHA
jgi:hypothetical protein